MMAKSSGGITIHILDKEYMIACSEDERHDLQRSADYLDKKMREIRDSGKIIGSDRIAVMAALNISHELLTQGGAGSSPDASVDTRIRSIQEKIDDALYRSRQLEI
ncbi:MAG: cell division protein ZapA [Gammaproteobacteria bacterium]|nr:cell division protein ZapA [Gammaproteobacteria bacterium]MCW8987997.1 cell division protein ZapA [Gammaproteobacteria bacterium]MCW9030661.1 cell division protein ZapA [Gammaproteobacteria bacterium]